MNHQGLLPYKEIVRTLQNDDDTSDDDDSYLRTNTGRSKQLTIPININSLTPCRNSKIHIIWHDMICNKAEFYYSHSQTFTVRCPADISSSKIPTAGGPAGGLRKFFIEPT
jgi:hypothetical protein